MKLANINFIRLFCNNVKSLRRARVSSRVQKRLRQSTKKLQKFVSGKTSIREKRSLLTQRGGFLGLLMPLIMKTVLV